MVFWAYSCIDIKFWSFYVDYSSVRPNTTPTALGNRQDVKQIMANVFYW